MPKITMGLGITWKLEDGNWIKVPEFTISDIDTGGNVAEQLANVKDAMEQVWGILVDEVETKVLLVIDDTKELIKKKERLLDIERRLEKLEEQLSKTGLSD